MKACAPTNKFFNYLGFCELIRFLSHSRFYESIYIINFWIIFQCA
jgi:hypothetical protein